MKLMCEIQKYSGIFCRTYNIPYYANASKYLASESVTCVTTATVENTQMRLQNVLN